MLRWRHRHTRLTRSACAILLFDTNKCNLRHPKDAKITIECRHQAASVAQTMFFQTSNEKKCTFSSRSMMMKEKYFPDSFDAIRNLCWISTQVNRNVMCFSLNSFGRTYKKLSAKKSVCISIFHLQLHSRGTSIGWSCFLSDDAHVYAFVAEPVEWAMPSDEAKKRENSI